jgi:sigma-B regulation protein RsbU (phosphoserine phosphatase)
MEVQQTLLPRDTPAASRLDLAGRSIYGDETGGDYCDFLWMGPVDSKALGIVLGDVFGHGVSSALLMAAARGCLRQRATMPGKRSQIVGDVNLLLSWDPSASDPFIFLFWVLRPLDTGRLTWVRAGHEPGILHHAKGAFLERLGGDGSAWGLNENAVLSENETFNPAPGDILVLGTDGIRETRNHRNVMFGQQRMLGIIRNHADRSAEHIRDRILDNVCEFIAPWASKTI